MPAYRRKPGARLPPPKLRDQPSRAARIFRRKKQTPFRVSRREHAVAFDGLPRSSFPLATPFSPKGNGCSSSCNPKPKATGGRHEQQKPGTIFARSDAAVYRQRALVSRTASTARWFSRTGPSMSPTTAALTGCWTKSPSPSFTSKPLPPKNFRCGSSKVDVARHTGIAHLRGRQRQQGVREGARIYRLPASRNHALVCQQHHLSAERILKRREPARDGSLSFFPPAFSANRS